MCGSWRHARKLERTPCATPSLQDGPGGDQAQRHGQGKVAGGKDRPGEGGNGGCTRTPALRGPPHAHTPTPPTLAPCLPALPRWWRTPTTCWPLCCSAMPLPWRLCPSFWIACSTQQQPSSSQSQPSSSLGRSSHRRSASATACRCGCGGGGAGFGARGVSGRRCAHSWWGTTAIHLPPASLCSLLRLCPGGGLPLLVCALPHAAHRGHNLAHRQAAGLGAGRGVGAVQARAAKAGGASWRASSRPTQPCRPARQW